jgi:hypothetical protein
MTLSIRSLVRGFVWKVRMRNGAEWEFWTPTSALTRSDARRTLLDLANGDYGEVYSASDIENLWRVKG